MNALHTRYDPKYPLQRATEIVKDKFLRIIEQEQLYAG